MNQRIVKCCLLFLITWISLRFMSTMMMCAIRRIFHFTRFSFWQRSLWITRLLLLILFIIPMWFTLGVAKTNFILFVTFNCKCVYWSVPLILILLVVSIVSVPCLIMSIGGGVLGRLAFFVKVILILRICRRCLLDKLQIAVNIYIYSGRLGRTTIYILGVFLRRHNNYYSLLLLLLLLLQ